MFRTRKSRVVSLLIIAVAITSTVVWAVDCSLPANTCNCTADPVFVQDDVRSQRVLEFVQNAEKQGYRVETKPDGMVVGIKDELHKTSPTTGD